MRNTNLKLTFLAVCTLAGCSQIIGLSDYDIDPKLGASEGGEGGAPAGVAGTHNTKGGSGGEPGQAGEPGAGGVPAAAGKSSGGTAGQVGGAGEAGEAGAGGAPLGEVVPCDSAECCDALGGKAVGVEMLKDGGFEVGTADDGSPWGEVSTGNYEAVTNDPDFGFKPKTGVYYAYLSGLASETTTLYQTFVIPKDAGWITVSGYRLFQVDTQDDVNMDFCGIGFYNSPAGDLLELPFYWGRPTDSTDGWGDAPTWKYFEKSWDAVPHQAQKREIDFRGSSDAYSTDTDVTASSYLFDDLSLKVYRCYK